ncbi:MAG: hypothetical protein ABR543_11520 [Gemmatimonadaceae bacterium]
MGIELLDPDRPDDAAAVAELHVAYLPHSLIVKLGRRFLTKYYYSTLVRDGLIGCTICRVDGRICGFIAYTPYPLDFMMRGVRRRYWSVAWILGASVLERPTLIADIVSVLRLIYLRGRESRETPASDMGEGISIATIPEYRDHIPLGGNMRLPVRLLHAMFEQLRASGRSRAYVLVESSNRASNVFCASMGGRREKIHHDGTPTHRFTFDLGNSLDQANVKAVKT